jgi:hypothetical protein
MEEVIANDMPEELCKPFLTVHYVDATLYHDLNTEQSVTRILSFCSHTMDNLFFTRQACVQTATFGSEFVEARIAVDQIIDLSETRRTLAYQLKDGDLCLVIIKL